MGPDGSRVSFYDGRGHRSLTVDPALAAEIFAGAGLAMFHLPDWARQLLPVARQAGAVIACDLQDVRDPDDEYLRDFLEGSDVLFVSSAHHPNPAPMLKQLVRRSGGSMVVCGRGGLGVAVATTEGIRVYPPPRSICRWWTSTAPATRSPSGSWWRTSSRAGRSRRPCCGASSPPAGPARSGPAAPAWSPGSSSRRSSSRPAPRCRRSDAAPSGTDIHG